MKKIISVLLTVVMVLALGSMTVFAATGYNGNVTGSITAGDTGVVTGTLTGAYNLTLSGTLSPTGDPQVFSFTGTVSGDIAGTISGKMNVNGNDSVFAEISGTGAAGHVYLMGGFPPVGIGGYFEGKIVTQASEITGISASAITVSATEGNLEAPVGGTLHMQMTAPAGYEVRWGVYVNDADYARIDADGTLHILKMPASGNTIIVMANTMEPNVSSTNITVTVTNPGTEVTANAGITYTVIIPASVDFGTIYKSMPEQSKAFPITVQDALLEEGKKITVVNATAAMAMKDNNGAGSNSLAFALSQNTFDFTADGTANATVSCTPADLQKAGSYKGTMTFSVSYLPAA